VAAAGVVEAFDEVEAGGLAWARVVKWCRSSSSVSRVAKKLSVTALSKQSATVPVDVRMPAEVHRLLNDMDA
jgi:hypothetical protein